MEETRPICERWRPRTAWICLLTTVLVTVVIGLISSAFLLSTTTDQGKWRGYHSREEMGVWIILSCTIPFAVALRFSDVRTMCAFKENFAFIPIKPEQVASAAATGFLIQAATIYLFEGGLAHLNLRTSFNAYVVAVLLALFLEEPVFRGF